MSKKLVKYAIICVLLITAAMSIAADAKSFSYPMKSDVVVKYWMDLHPNLAATAKNFGDTPLAKELERRTGVKVHYIHPVINQELEQLNLFIASGDLPDVMEYPWTAYPGGPNAALSSGAILRLNTVFDKYAPNLKKYLKAHPDWDRMIKTDTGDYYVFPFFRAGQSLLVTSGPVVRKDWLNDLKLRLPETIDDWYVMLKAFKEKKGAIAPLTISTVNLITDFGPAFDVCGDQQGFYVENGKVHYSFDSHGYGEFLKTMHKWYSEGLLDKNFTMFTNKSRDANMLTGKSGATDSPAASGIGVWLDVMEKKDPKFDVTGTRYCSPKRGQLPRFIRHPPIYGGNNNKGNAAISAKAKPEVVEAVARMLDYNYSPEGIRLMNFGIQGVSYKLVNGKPKYTEAMMNDPKLSPTTQLSKYIRANYYGPFPQIPEYLNEYYQRPQMKEAQKYWMQNTYDKYQMPPITPTNAEAQELGRLLTQIQTYVDEMTLKYIYGTEPLSNYENYTKQLKKLGVDRVIEIYQKAYTRYIHRK